MKVNVKDLKSNLEFSFLEISVDEFKKLWLTNNENEQEGLEIVNIIEDKLLSSKLPENSHVKIQNSAVDVRLNQLDNFIPGVDFIIKGKSLMTKFNGSMRKVRIKDMKSKNQEWSFTRISEGDIILLLKNKKLDSVFIAKKDWITPSGSLHITSGSARHVAIQINTPRILKNLKQPKI